MLDFNRYSKDCPWVTMREKRRKDRNDEDDTVLIWFEELYYCKATGMGCDESNCAPLYLWKMIEEN